MFLSEDQLHELQSIINDAHSAFVANYVAPQAIPQDVLRQLQAAGVINPQASTIRDAYAYGVLATILRDRPDLSSGTYQQLVSAIRANPVPQSAVERQAVAVAQLSAAQYIQGIGVRMAQAVGSEVMQTDAEARADLQERVQRVVTAGIDSRASLQQVASNLGHETQDWTRDLRRVANTEVAMAMQQGASDTIQKKYGKNARVVVKSAPSCCDRCLALYGSNTHPRIFSLSELQNNGTNVGRKADDALAVIPPNHPNCRCVMVYLPDGFGFNDQGQMVPEAMIRSRVHFEADMFREPARPVFFKAAKGDEVPGHAYTHRTGSPGHYHYAYPADVQDPESHAAAENEMHLHILREYQQDSAPIQAFARGKSNDKPGTDGYAYMEAKQEGLDNAIGRGHFAQETVLWRGSQDAQVKTLQVGDIFTEPGYMSFTHDEDVASRFSKYAGPNRIHAVILRIQLPAKHPALNMPSHVPGSERSNHQAGEKEVLLPRGMRFRVVSVSQHPKGPPLIELEVIDGKEEKAGR